MTFQPLDCAKYSLKEGENELDDYDHFLKKPLTDLAFPRVKITAFFDQK